MPPRGQRTVTLAAGLGNGKHQLIPAHQPATGENVLPQPAASTTRLARTHTSGTASTRSCETSQAYVLMAGSVLKYVYRNNEDLTINCDPDVLDRAVEQALSVFRSAFKEIS